MTKVKHSHSIQRIGICNILSVNHVIIVQQCDWILEVHRHYRIIFFVVPYSSHEVAVKHDFNSISELYFLQFYCLVYSVGLKNVSNCEQKEHLDIRHDGIDCFCLLQCQRSNAPVVFIWALAFNCGSHFWSIWLGILCSKWLQFD